jgi:rubrerythrin
MKINSKIPIVSLSILVPLILGGAGFAASPLKPGDRQALDEAIADEYKARAFYQATIDRFGSVRPFSNIINAETRHADMVADLFVQYGLPVPEDTYMGKVEAPDTLLAACEAGVQAEIDNKELYDRLLPNVSEPDIRTTLERLRNASQNNHLPAFQNCVQRYSR